MSMLDPAVLRRAFRDAHPAFFVVPVVMISLIAIAGVVKGMRPLRPPWEW